MSEDHLLPGTTDYLLSLIPKRDPVLVEMETLAEQKDFPIVGPMVGQFLLQYALLVGARRILELGSGFGYSALWFTKASDEVRVICTDWSEKNARMANSNFERAGVLHQVEFHVGDALEILAELEGDFDIIMNDVDKEEYPKAFAAAVPRLRPGGLLITDNALWHGLVIEPASHDEAARGAREYNKLAFSDPRVISTLVPIRDGLCVSMRT